jgi:hypothetical protein
VLNVDKDMEFYGKTLQQIWKLLSNESSKDLEEAGLELTSQYISLVMELDLPLQKWKLTNGTKSILTDQRQWLNSDVPKNEGMSVNNWAQNLH